MPKSRISEYIKALNWLPEQSAAPDKAPKAPAPSTPPKGSRLTKVAREDDLISKILGEPKNEADFLIIPKKAMEPATFKLIQSLNPEYLLDRNKYKRPLKIKQQLLEYENPNLDKDSVYYINRLIEKSINQQLTKPTYRSSSVPPKEKEVLALPQIGGRNEEAIDNLYAKSLQKYNEID